MAAVESHLATMRAHPNRTTSIVREKKEKDEILNTS